MAFACADQSDRKQDSASGSPPATSPATRIDVVEQALITPEDMPLAGWQVVRGPAEGSLPEVCGSAVGNAHPSSARGSLLQYASTNLLFAQTVARFETAKEAEAAMAKIQELTDSCAGFIARLQGSEFAMEAVAPLTPAIGADVIAIRLSGEHPSLGPLQSDEIHMRADDVVISIGFSSDSFVRLEDTQMEEIARIALEKANMPTGPSP